jgi:hypothetical protein
MTKLRCKKIKKGKGKDKNEMTDVKFIKICKEAVKNYANEHHFFDSSVRQKDVFIVWYCKTLQNWKALVSTTVSDGMYYEVTYNGDKRETYLDAYKKWENVRIAD